jgi:two-component system KDP operon response regulator KdpE
MKILIVENYTSIFKDVKQMFELYYPEAELINAISNEQCLVDIATNNIAPDLIILGMNLSDIHGLYLLTLLRDYSDVPVIVISSDKSIEALVSAFDAGANDYIVEPFNKSVFVARLKALARRRYWDIQSSSADSKKNNRQVIYSSLPG